MRTSTGFAKVIISLVRPIPGQRPCCGGSRPRRAGGLRGKKQKAEADPARLQKMLRRTYLRGESTYCIEHGDDAYGRLWGESSGTRDLPEPRAGSWHPSDAVLTVLRGSGGELLGTLDGR